MTNPPYLPTLKAYPTPGEGDRFIFFFAKMRGKGELKGAPEQFYPSDVCFWAPERKLFWGGCCNPLRGTRRFLKINFNKCIFQQQQQQQQNKNQTKTKQNKIVWSELYKILSILTMVNHFRKSVDAILEDVSVTKTIVWC